MNKKQELSEYRDWIKALKSKIYDTKRKVDIPVILTVSKIFAT